MYNRRTIREAMLQAHQNKENFGEEWFVLDNDHLDVVKISYFYDEVGNKKDKPYVDIYSTDDKRYGHRDHLVEFIDDRIFIVDEKDKQIPEKFKEKNEVFQHIVSYFIDNFLEEVDFQDSYVNVLNTHIFTTIRTQIIDVYLFNRLRTVEMFKNIKFHSSDDANTFHIEKEDSDEFIITFCIEVENFDLNIKDADNVLRSLDGLEKFKI